MKNILLFLTVLLLSTTYAQKAPTAVKITYIKSSNGTVIENQDPILVFTDQVQTNITSEKISTKKASFPYELYSLNRTTNHWFQTAQLSASKAISTKDSMSISNQKFTFSAETKKILGYLCQKATTSINSNTIDVWYTKDLGLKGAPTVLGQDLGLVLEVTRNNNYTIIATKIEKLKSIPNDVTISADAKSKLDLLSYRDELWKSRFTTIAIFENETINFSDQSKSNDSIFRFANGTVLIKKIKVGKI